MIRTDNLIKEAKEVLQWDILKFWSVMQDPQGSDLTASQIGRLPGAFS